MPQCRLEGDKAALRAFQRVAEQRIRTFLRSHDLPEEAVYNISFGIHISEGSELRMEMQGKIPEDLLEQLGTALLNMARQRGICEFDYFPPSSPEATSEEACDGAGVIIGTIDGHSVYLCDTDE
jgi:hypothetical protein